MTTLQLEPEETAMLCDILESYLSDLRMEIADTDQMDFREKLKKKADFIRTVIDRCRP